jgi:hypothetical protein
VGTREKEIKRGWVEINREVRDRVEEKNELIIAMDPLHPASG